MAIIPCALPTPKLASRMRLSSFPFPRRPSASPRPLRLRAPKPAAAPSPARIRRNQTTYCQTRAWPISHVIERERSSTKKGFLPARFCVSRLARSPRTATACRTARSMPRRTTHHPFPPPPSSLRPETRCESATCTSRACASSRRTSRAVIGARGSSHSHSRGSTFV